MYKKIIIFGDSINFFGKVFAKSAAVLRLSYMLRQRGYEVRQVHHCTSFNYEELKIVVEDFSQGEPVLVCASSSFLSSLKRKNQLHKDMVNNHQSKGAFWGDRSFLFLINIGKICKEKGYPYLLGGWEIDENKINNSGHHWGFDILSNYVTYFVTGKDVDVIERVCKDEPVEFKMVREAKVAQSAELKDFSDCASTPLATDYIKKNEALVTEIAAGCIFSCSFCNYAALGKKKNEFVRTYDSLEREIISNYENFGTTIYTLTDNIINDYPEKLRYLTDIRNKTGIDLRWVGYARLDTIKTKDQARMLAESGMIGASFGIESFHKETGKYIGKMTEKSRLVDSLGLVRDAIGDTAIVSGLFIAGLPQETMTDVYKTYEWLNSIEGRYYIDSYVFTRLMINMENNDKNEINKSRNNPFRDYVFSSKYKWTSPWGTLEQYSLLARKFNEKSSNKFVAPFTLPWYHNIGYDITLLVKCLRDSSKTGKPFSLMEDYPNYVVGHTEHEKLSIEYKDLMIRDITNKRV